MDEVNTLRRYGLFDAKVPRYTSYPPANRFESGIGTRFQAGWMGAIPPSQPVSVYVHIPFCRRLCWFCACRTQGTQTLGPVAAYADTLLQEIDTAARDALPQGLSMARLHLGGGTPTLLDPGLMSRLLERVFTHFKPTEDFEFSVEIDPTEASDEILATLADWDMTRASVGVQDFAPEVQAAIGREQSFEVTREVIAKLREGGVKSLNLDVLYGLPYQTECGLAETLDRVVDLGPDRLALYGYAHVPHVSKRQVMIPSDALPDGVTRFEMARFAKARLVQQGYEALGIDHFALPADSLTKAAKAGAMFRNFQGYTDDPCETLLGFGASAISKFKQGYVQNAVSTSAYTQRVQTTGLAAHKGIVLSAEDRFIATLVSDLMCTGALRFARLNGRFPDRVQELDALADALMHRFPDLLIREPGGLRLPDGLSAAARLIAGHLDRSGTGSHIHSLAV